MVSTIRASRKGLGGTSATTRATQIAQQRVSVLDPAARATSGGGLASPGTPQTGADRGEPTSFLNAAPARTSSEQPVTFTPMTAAGQPTQPTSQTYTFAKLVGDKFQVIKSFNTSNPVYAQQKYAELRGQFAPPQDITPSGQAKLYALQQKQVEPQFKPGDFITYNTESGGTIQGFVLERPLDLGEKTITKQQQQTFGTITMRPPTIAEVDVQSLERELSGQRKYTVPLIESFVNTTALKKIAGAGGIKGFAAQAAEYGLEKASTPLSTGGKAVYYGSVGALIGGGIGTAELGLAKTFPNLVGTGGYKAVKFATTIVPLGTSLAVSGAKTYYAEKPGAEFTKEFAITGISLVGGIGGYKAVQKNYLKNIGLADVEVIGFNQGKTQRYSIRTNEQAKTFDQTLSEADLFVAGNKYNVKGVNIGVTTGEVGAAISRQKGKFVVVPETLTGEYTGGTTYGVTTKANIITTKNPLGKVSIGTAEINIGNGKKTTNTFGEIFGLSNKNKNLNFGEQISGINIKPNPKSQYKLTKGGIEYRPLTEKEVNNIYSNLKKTRDLTLNIANPKNPQPEVNYNLINPNERRGFLSFLESKKPVQAKLEAPLGQGELKGNWIMDTFQNKLPKNTISFFKETTAKGGITQIGSGFKSTLKQLKSFSVSAKGKQADELISEMFNIKSITPGKGSLYGNFKGVASGKSNLGLLSGTKQKVMLGSPNQNALFLEYAKSAVKNIRNQEAQQVVNRMGSFKSSNRIFTETKQTAQPKLKINLISEEIAGPKPQRTGSGFSPGIIVGSIRNPFVIRSVVSPLIGNIRGIAPGYRQSLRLNTEAITGYRQQGKQDQPQTQFPGLKIDITQIQVPELKTPPPTKTTTKIKTDLVPPIFPRTGWGFTPPPPSITPPPGIALGGGFGVFGGNYSRTRRQKKRPTRSLLGIEFKLPKLNKKFFTGLEIR